MNEPTQDSEPTFEVLPPQQLPPPPKLRHARSLANLWYIFINLRGDLAPNTRRNWEQIARRFCHFFAKRKLNPQTMVEWMTYLQNYKAPDHAYRNLNPRFINRLNVDVGAFLKWMWKMKYLHEDLSEHLPKLLTQALPPPKIITEEEYEGIKKYLTGHENFQAHLWLCILAYRTGMSLIDCCHLRWKDVHLNEDGPSFIDIHRIKTARHGSKSLCQIPIVAFSDVHTWLLHLKTVPRYKRFDGIEDYVHQETEGLYKYVATPIRQDFKRLFEHCGVSDGKTFKHFRNAFCSNLVNSGMPLPLICKITGHQSVTTLLGYLKPDRNALQEGMVKSQQYSSGTNPVAGKGNIGLVNETDEEDEDDEDDEEEEDDKD